MSTNTEASTSAISDEDLITLFMTNQSGGTRGALRTVWNEAQRRVLEEQARRTDTVTPSTPAQK